jgi:hypothetical protein
MPVEFVVAWTGTSEFVKMNMTVMGLIVSPPSKQSLTTSGLRKEYRIPYERT